MEKHKSNEFAKSVSLYISTMIIINNVLSHNSRLSCKYDGEIPTTIHMVTHISTHGIGQDGSKIIKSKVKTKTELNFSGVQTLTGLWNLQKIFPIEEFKAAFMEWVICDNITLRQSMSQWLQKMFALVDKITEMVLP